MLTKEVYLQLTRERFYDIFVGSAEVFLTHELNALLEDDIQTILQYRETLYPPMYFYSLSKGAIRATDDELFLSLLHVEDSARNFSLDHANELYVIWKYSLKDNVYDDGKPLTVVLNGQYFCGSRFIC